MVYLFYYYYNFELHRELFHYFILDIHYPNINCINYFLFTNFIEFVMILNLSNSIMIIDEDDQLAYYNITIAIYSQPNH